MWVALPYAPDSPTVNDVAFTVPPTKTLSFISIKLFSVSQTSLPLIKQSFPTLILVVEFLVLTYAYHCC